MKNLFSVLLACVLCSLFFSPPDARAQSTAFTYQGQLKDGGSPANGSYDLQFALFNALSGGAQQGPTLTNAATAVSNGLFTITLDFGAQFPGAARWLELGVRTNGGGAFGVLTPRQPITPTPYAITSANAGTAAALSGNVPVAQLTGTIPLAQLPSAVVTNGAGGLNLSGTLTGNLVGNASTASTATSAATAGTANNFSGALAGDVTGTQGATVVGGVGGQSAANVAGGAVAANAATSANTTNTMVKRDASGNFAAGTITAALAGNATTATTAANVTGNITDTQLSPNMARLNGTNQFTATNSFSGVVLATNANNVFNGTLNGSLVGNVTGNAATATTATSFSGSLAGDVTGTQGATVVGTVGGQSAANVASGAIAANAATSVNTANTLVKRDAAGNLSASNITANLIGNAATATTATNLVGNVADAQLSANVAFLNGTNLFSGTNRFTGVVIATNAGNQFAGSGAGLTNLFVTGPINESPTNVIPVRGLVWIRPGVFVMGSRSDEVGRAVNEGPQTVVTLTRGFWMGEHEVTQTEYLAVVGSNPSSFTGDLNRPVEMISWNAATNYCSLLTTAERTAGRIPATWSYRLPTEAEWEYCARAGARTTRFAYGDDPSLAGLTNNAWYSANSTNTTRPVGQKLPNPWGLNDMSGNVFEWCADWYTNTLSGGSVTDPVGPNSGTQRVNRSGSWFSTFSNVRSAARRGDAPTGTFSDGGFRIVLAPN